MIAQLQNLLAAGWKRLSPPPAVDPPTRRLIEFNKQRWPWEDRAGRDSVVLLGLIPAKPSIFCYAYVANHLAERTNSRIEAFQFVGAAGPVLRETYESFGARHTLSLANATVGPDALAQQADDLFGGLRTKWDLLNLTVDGLLIGDQIYDTYLRWFNEPTVQLSDPRLKDVIRQALHIYHAAKAYLSRNRVAAFITDDYSYINSGIITRMLFLAKVPIYMVLFGERFTLLQLDPAPSGLSPHGQGHNFPPPAAVPYYRFPELFAALSAEARTGAVGNARKRLAARFSGENDALVRMKETTYGAGEGTVFQETGRPRVLVMLHDFIDSPHGFRSMLFPDFYEWIHFVLQTAEQTPFEWYVKPHPCTADPSRSALNLANAKVIDELKARFPKATFLPASTSNRQILAEGVSAMFTVHGTAGHEFAYHGIPVVNSGDNRHANYAFTIHARSVDHYAECLRGADRLALEIDRREIEEYFHMTYFYIADRLGSPVNPIDERFFAAPDWAARIHDSASFDEFLAGVSPEREAGVARYFDDFFNQSATPSKL